MLSPCCAAARQHVAPLLSSDYLCVCAPMVGGCKLLFHIPFLPCAVGRATCKYRSGERTATMRQVAADWRGIVAQQMDSLIRLRGDSWLEPSWSATVVFWRLGGAEGMQTQPDHRRRDGGGGGGSSGSAGRDRQAQPKR